MSGNYPFVANFLIEFLPTFALDYAVVLLRISTTTYSLKKCFTFYEKLVRYIKKSPQNTRFYCSKEKIQVQEMRRAIFDSDNIMPNCFMA